MKTSRAVSIYEVSPRDGFQNEQVDIATGEKISFVNRLSRIGFNKIEVSSFVSPAAAPQLRDADEVFRRIERVPGTVYVALVPNVRGVDRAVAARVDEVNFVASVSEAHNQANMRMSCGRSIELLKDVAGVLAGTGIGLNATAATAFVCPFEGEQPVDKTIVQIGKYLDAGAKSITMADTIGAANPRQVAILIERFNKEFGKVPLTLHFHDTRGMALANILCAYECGASRFDAALGGIGGCPFAPGATGNACTEDVVHMFESMAVPSGLHFDALMDVARTLPALVGHDVPSHLLRAGASWQCGRVLSA